MVIKPLVSVVIPVYNGREVIIPAIRSMLAQTWENVEIIVVDDKSTDGTAEIISTTFDDDRIRLIRHRQNQGAALARNSGIAVAKGDFIAFMDADDISVPERIEAQIRFLENQGSLVGAVGSSVELFGRDNGAIDVLCAPEEVAASTMFSCEFLMPSLTCRRAALDALDSLFRPEYGPNCDWEIVARLVTKTGVANMQERLVKYRRWPQQMTVKIVDTLGCPATLLRSEMLEWFGICRPEQDLAAHVTVAPCYWPMELALDQFVTPTQAKKWLEKVRTTNNVHRKFNQKALDHVLHRAALNVAARRQAAAAAFSSSQVVVGPLPAAA